ncbi:YdaS family helix-turn-helix protein [Marinobacter sp. UBA2498]|jgi:DNA-binding transcriptional regulator YdaS (Cro superfamily)|uniref:YdaS family helix-turn-helix protein n=1 Tax=Marinobacter sp. UBA2498 TaxID=1946813 RepID=UPI00257E1439|nr:YdaS family helix-turn-helix protein [Marinobacter sp. UBA2498]|tara:strand:- start:1281 stop:1520 length:240 start_codon:yes stop_codon:yes gene_type:complete
MESDIQIDKLVSILGSKAALARACGVRLPTIYGWTRIPARHVLTLEAAVRAAGGDIDRYDMRPDIYGQRPQSTERRSVA